MIRSPISGSNNTELLASVPTEEIAQRWLTGMKINVAQSFLELGTLELWHCKDTGLMWYEPAGAAGGGELYSQLETFDWYYMRDKWEFDVAQRLVSRGQKILEVGVGYGYFLEHCRLNNTNVVGIELNPTAARKVREKGFQVFEESLDDLANRVGDGAFNVICSFQVLEHVSNPLAFIQGMLGNLQVGGRLILSVPNAAIMRRIDPEHRELLNQPPHHMSHWDEGVFRALQKYLPVRVRSVHREPMAQYHVNWITIAYFRNMFPGFGKKLNRFIFNRFSMLPLLVLLRLGLRKFVPGHTLLVELEKVS